MSAVEHETVTEQFETIKFSVQGKICTIELNRPSTLNAFNQQMRRDLHSAIDMADTNPSVRVVIVKGAGPCFSAGADLKELTAAKHGIEAQIMNEYKPFLSRIIQSDKIYLAAVQGAAAGIGGALALTCDLVVMSEEACLFQAFAAIALVPDGGASWHLVNNLGYKKAFELCVEADKLSAEECIQTGLANHSVAAGDLDEYTCAWAERLAAGAPLSQKYLKRLLQQAQRAGLHDTIRQEAQYQQFCFNSEDFQEGVSAFFAKRQPVFSGK
ncbi:enoyl-CoA hydratase [Shewanella sp. NFH-SH190041]|uniref:enoyl-CoA hydratase/isomerase family protein n=1 Tax=Shewanella sp. NFH-SH190041 TaxID=2950245 RepID=UPI0021C475F5|nr:enoyl-CoA hydratase/isomerase family protein [Shewanella sp. NFH-SH190041]BDM64318.1 enoyl-CoA hydratase [Shewanella sp. NFH-SH190041]